MSRTKLQQEEFCGNCAYFRRHYVKIRGRYDPLHLGHCVYPRLKDRPDDEHCPHWVPAPADPADLEELLALDDPEGAPPAARP